MGATEDREQGWMPAGLMLVLVLAGGAAWVALRPHPALTPLRQHHWRTDIRAGDPASPGTAAPAQPASPGPQQPAEAPGDARAAAAAAAAAAAGPRVATAGTTAAGGAAAQPGAHITANDVPATSSSCDELLLQAASGECREMLSSEAHSLRVFVCSRRAESGSGVLLLLPWAQQEQPSSGLAAMPGARVVMLRLVGPEVLLLPVHACGGDTQLAEFALSQPGNFSVEVLQLWRRFRFTKPPPTERSLRVGSFTLNVTAAGRSSSCPAPACPACTANQLLKPRGTIGRWVTQQPDHPAIQQLRTTNTGTKLPKLLLPLAHTDSQLLEWMPYACTLSHLRWANNSATPVVGGAGALLSAPAGTASCSLGLIMHRAQEAARDGKKICFVGDSQQRHLHYTAAAVLGALGSGGQYVPYLNKRDKGLHVNPLTAYVPSEFGQAVDTTNCSVVLQNFGQWPLSLRAYNPKGPPQPWSAVRYAEAARVVAQRLAALPLARRAIWVSSNALPLFNIHLAPGGPSDFRFEPYLRLFNRIAEAEMVRAGVPVLDAFAISSPLLDVSYDVAHYAGVVGHALARAALTAALC